ncbi:phage repressor protein C with HTH and peptisase S24 domain [Natronospira proteinivora]|uniref:Phage repressor protein C with HTH and peptisase S24 domain n=1 Tax=Natronospira proteinivora TaxID=1807133 RepID=A0ABT1G4N9_9GAMM|nr:LexA family transcriptional regulator [Natronospira proteinivora]MCP1726255.1 phage repressor protein C with HTH and peptisase S24 domain [Natronospira proteinivora]
MLKTRLRKCAELVGNGASLARATGIPRRTLETYLSGTAEPKASRLADIARVAGVSGHWLLTGEGTSRSNGGEPVSEFQLVQRPAVSKADPPRRAGEVAGNGGLGFQREWIARQGWEERHLRLLEAHGDSMVPTICDGSLLLVDVSVNILQEEGIFLLEVDDILLLRRLQFDVEGGVLAVNDNPAYREQYLRKAHKDELSVYGKVVWVGNRIA